MRDDDPLEQWLFTDQMRGYDKMPAKSYKQTRTVLRRLSAILDAPVSKKAKLTDSGISRWSMHVLDPADLSRACDLCRRLMARGGSGSTFVQEGLLEMIASTKDIASIPFWLEILDFNRPRDPFSETRRMYALAALARIALRHDVPERYGPLRTAVRHQNPEVRALAAYYLGRACLEGKNSPPPEVRAELKEIALRDPSFGPRFQARKVLQAAGEPAPLDYPRGMFLFKLALGGGSNYRIIAVRSKQTLDDLHYGIQSAIHWDADHLYSFFMNGKRYDQRYAFACPYEDNPPFTTEATIGNLGLMLNHKFLYLFDYGDCHEFEVKVVDIRPEAERSEYPCVVESHGKAPEQYPRWE